MLLQVSFKVICYTDYHSYTRTGNAKKDVEHLSLSIDKAPEYGVPIDFLLSRYPLNTYADRIACVELHMDRKRRDHNLLQKLGERWTVLVVTIPEGFIMANFIPDGGSVGDVYTTASCDEAVLLPLDARMSNVSTILASIHRVDTRQIDFLHEETKTDPLIKSVYGRRAYIPYYCYDTIPLGKMNSEERHQTLEVALGSRVSKLLDPVESKQEGGDLLPITITTDSHSYSYSLNKARVLKLAPDSFFAGLCRGNFTSPVTVNTEDYVDTDHDDLKLCWEVWIDYVNTGRLATVYLWKHCWRLLKRLGEMLSISIVERWKGVFLSILLDTY